MKNRSTRSVKSKTTAFIAALLVCLFTAVCVDAQQNSEPLTNAAVIKLVKAGFKEKTIVAIIQSRPSDFKLDTEQLIQLKRNGVSENIILVMMAADGSYSGDADDWADSEFFSKKAGEPGSQQQADIFGSSSGSKSQTKTRGTRGGNDSEGTVTGSATVRIIRPPAESGGATPKLERTPALTNDAVVQMVEAGFSEGTIIKRISESPAEFDLSPSKLDELHKRRVTEPIISAMAAAMNEEKPANPAPAKEK
jgi:hypothetical protein